MKSNKERGLVEIATQQNLHLNIFQIFSIEQDVAKSIRHDRSKTAILKSITVEIPN